MSFTHPQSHNRRFLYLIFGLFLVLLAPAANAITKHLSMIDASGKPLVTTIINITGPDGKSTKRVTDKKGILEHNFKQAGVYTLSDESGNTIKTVSVAGSSMSKPVMYGVAAGGALVLLLAVGGSSSADAPPPPAPGDPEPPVGGVPGELAGTYNVNATVASNPDDLPILINSLVLNFEIIGTALTITQTSNNINFPATLSGTIVDEAFSASASGKYGEDATLFQLAGAISIAQGLIALINIGTDGSLPGGKILTYNATGTK